MLPEPLIALILSFSTFISILGLTSSGSLLRPAFVPLMLIYVYVGSGSHYSFRHPTSAIFIGGTVFGIALRYMDSALLSRWTFDAKGPTSMRGGLTPIISESSGDSRIAQATRSPNILSTRRPSHQTTSSGAALTTIPSRLWWVASHFFDNRFNATPWEVANVPPFSRHDPTAVPSRISFVSYSAAVSVICILLLDAVGLLAGPPEMNAVLFAKERVGLFLRLGDVTVEEMVLRFVSATMFWVITYMMLQGLHSGAGAVMVGLNLSDVQRWKPWFGRMADAWSLRQFWGVFWHQGLRQMLTSPARFTTYAVLGLRKGGLAGRYTFIFLTFLLSGMLHFCGELTAGLSWRETGGLWFFSMQTLGIILEDAVQAAYRKLRRSRTKGAKKGEVSLWERLVGYLWVMLWMMWSVPTFSYPTARRSKGEGVLPFSLLGGILRTPDK